VSFQFKMSQLNMRLLESHPLYMANKAQFVHRAVVEKLIKDREMIGDASKEDYTITRKTHGYAKAP